MAQIWHNIISKTHKTSSAYMMNQEKSLVERRDQNSIEYILYHIIKLEKKSGKASINVWHCKHEIKKQTMNEKWTNRCRCFETIGGTDKYPPALFKTKGKLNYQSPSFYYQFLLGGQQRIF